jgi:hypothetical protein
VAHQWQRIDSKLLWHCSWPKWGKLQIQRVHGLMVGKAGTSSKRGLPRTIFVAWLGWGSGGGGGHRRLAWCGRKEEERRAQGLAGAGDKGVAVGRGSRPCCGGLLRTAPCDDSACATGHSTAAHGAWQ